MYETFTVCDWQVFVTKRLCIPIWNWHIYFPDSEKQKWGGGIVMIFNFPKPTNWLSQHCLTEMWCDNCFLTETLDTLLARYTHQGKYFWGPCKHVGFHCLPCNVHSANFILPHWQQPTVWARHPPDTTFLGLSQFPSFVCKPSWYLPSDLPSSPSLTFWLAVCLFLSSSK